MKLASSTMHAMNIACTEHGETQASNLFQDAATVYTDTHIMRERRQDVNGRIFVVNSIFDRFATQTAEDRLRSLVEFEAEKDGRNAV